MTTNIQNNLEKNNETSNFFSISKNVKKQTILKNLEENNTINDICSLNSDTIENNCNIKNDIEAFRKFHLFQTKKISYNNSIYGLTHIKLAFFVKDSSRYDNYIQTLINKVNKSIEISDANNEKKGEFFVYLDLENANPRNFSKKFLKKVAHVTSTLYVDQLINYFISGKRNIIKMFWPIISLFLDKKTKNKIIFLE